MWRALLIAIVADASSAYADANTDAAARLADQARADARAGRCEVAIAELDQLTALDAEAARVAIVGDPWLAGCETGHPLGPAQPAGVVSGRASPWRAYFSPSLLANTWITDVGLADVVLLHRIAAGMSRRCSCSTLSLGGTLDVAQVSRFGHSVVGAGVEAEYAMRAGPYLQIGPRVGAARFKSPGPHTFISAGARLHVVDTFFVAADAYWAHVRGSEEDGLPSASGFGFMAGAGFEGRAGAGIVAAELLLAGISVAVLAALAPSSSD